MNLSFRHSLPVLGATVLAFVAVFGSTLTSAEPRVPHKREATERFAWQPAAESPAPRLAIGDLDYQGAFRLTLTVDDVSRLGWSQGTIGLGRGGSSLYVTGHPRDAAVAEFPIVAPSLGDALETLPLSGPPIQGFSQLIDRVPAGNPQRIDRYSGLFELDGALIANAYEYYDAPANNTHTTLTVADASRLSDSPVEGWGEMSGATRAAGWTSPVPAEWQAALGAAFISGNSSGSPINSRHSIGPSAWATDLDPSLGGLDRAEPLMDFPLATPIVDDFASGGNDLWTALSEASYGFIVPGTRTYFVIGHSGGHDSGVSYGISPGRSKGYFANDPSDYTPFYWLFDVGDFVAVRNGLLDPHELRPYEHGPIELPFIEMSGDKQYRGVGGATFDPESSTLYVALTDVDRVQSRYDHVPVILTYAVPTLGSSNPVGAIPDPVVPSPVAPGPVAPAPVAPGPVVPDSAKPGPAAPNPADPEMARPDSSTRFCPSYEDSALYRNRSIQVRVSPGQDWEAALTRAPAGSEILFDDGEYRFTRDAVYLEQADLTIRSASGNRDAVVLRGKGYGARGEGLMIAGPNVTIAEITITGAREHGISIKPEVAGTATHVYGVHLYDIGTQFIKGSSGGPNPGGVVACSSMGYTADGAEGDYIGAIDVFSAIDWVIRDNYIYNMTGSGTGCEVFNCNISYVPGPAITLWQNSAGGVIERNTIVDSFRGITLGLSTPHVGGVVRNNFIIDSEDAGIELWNAGGVLVEHNTAFTTGYRGAIEYGGAPDSVIRNNLLSHPVLDRSSSRGESPGVMVTGNIGTGSVDDLQSKTTPRLSPSSQAIGAGVPSPLSTDHEGSYRLDRYDVGADHYTG